MRAQRHNFGFTLLELILVMLILTIAVAISAPSLGNFSRGRVLDNNAARFLSLTRWARSQAISDGTTYRINIDPSKRAFTVSYNNRGSYSAYTAGRDRGFTLPEELSVATDAPLEESLYVIDFDPMGYSTTARVTLTGSKGNKIVVECASRHDVFRIAQKNDGGQS